MGRLRRPFLFPDGQLRARSVSVKPKVFAYAGCDTCRNALKFLRNHGVEFELAPIRERPPSVGELKRMLMIYGGDLRKLFNTSGADYKALNLKDKLPKLSVEAALEMLSLNGNLVKRPFLLTEKAGVVGFKSEEWENLFL